MQDEICIECDNFAYVGSYATGTKATNYLICDEGWNGEILECEDFYLILRLYVSRLTIWNTQMYVPPALIKQ